MEEKKKGQVLFEDEGGIYVMEYEQAIPDGESIKHEIQLEAIVVGAEIKKEFDDTQKFKKKNKKQVVEIITLKGDESDGH